MSYFADEDVYRRFEKHNYVLSFIHCLGICVYIVYSLLKAWLMRRSSCRRKFHGKGIKWKTFPDNFVISLCGVVVRCSRVKSEVPGSSPTEFFIPAFCFFPFFVNCVVVFYKYIAKQLLLNKVQQTARKVLCFQRKYRAPYFKYMDKQTEFLLFPTIYCGKPRVDNHLIIF